MRPMSTDARSVVCMSVCLSVWHTDEPCKTAKSIETPLGEQTPVGPKNHILNGGLHRRHLTNTAESSTRGGDTALYQITLTTCIILYTHKGLKIVKNVLPFHAAVNIHSIA